MARRATSVRPGRTPAVDGSAAARTVEGSAVVPLDSAAVNGPLIAFVRITLGVLWLTNTAWKVPPDFGQRGNAGLYAFTRDAIDHPVFPPYSWVVRHLVLEHFRLFGWGVLLLESTLAALLLLGLCTRLAAGVGALQAAAIGLSVALSPGEWPWTYYLMVLAHLAVLATPAAGRTWGLDGLLRPLVRGRRGLAGLYRRVS